MTLYLLHQTLLHFVQIFFEKYNACNETIKIVAAITNVLILIILLSLVIFSLKILTVGKLIIRGIPEYV